MPSCSTVHTCPSKCNKNKINKLKNQWLVESAGVLTSPKGFSNVQHVGSQRPSPLPCVNTIPFHLSCSPTSLSSGLEIMIACCSVTFLATASQSPAHTVYFFYCSLRSLASPALSIYTAPILCFLLLFLSILHSLQCLCDRSDRLYNMSLRIYLTFNISIKCQCRLV